MLFLKWSDDAKKVQFACPRNHLQQTRFIFSTVTGLDCRLSPSSFQPQRCHAVILRDIHISACVLYVVLKSVRSESPPQPSSGLSFFSLDYFVFPDAAERL